MKKILIIEDDQIVANIYRNKFSVEGFKVEIALDGEVGFEMVQSFKPDAVILDLMLPKITGVDLMKKIRAEPDFKTLPVIVFSNTYLTNMVQEAWKAGATKCLSKANCTPKQVIDVVRSALGLNGAAMPAVQPDAALAIPQPAPKPAAAAAAPHRAPAPAAPAAQTPAPADDPDAEFQAELCKSFVESLPATLSTLRALLQAIIKAENESARLKPLHELYRRIHALTGNAGLAGMLQISQMADALEALLKELYEKPKNVNASTLRTVASAIDFLGVLFERSGLPEQQEVPPVNIMVVDDEAISRRAITYALEKAKLKSVSIEDPLVAFQQLSEKKFDLIILDVDMPGMNGFELCSKLRALPEYKSTPVVFVTSLNDFESRASSTMSGGNDFIGKPFLFIELAVKALVYVLRGRMQLVKA
jgi:DNA-binding response OmpR family regulator/HPt (histidine-containing phosphotransfer) domain-containing protein